MAKFSKEEIEEVIKEYSKKCYHGTDKPVELSKEDAVRVLRSRKYFDDYINSVHPSHDMTDWYTEIKSPVGTARFYKVRRCKKCEGEQYHHPAGRFIDSELKGECYE